MVLLPEIKYVKLNVVFSITVDGAEHVEEFCASPYYSADELAVLLFNQYDIPPDQFCLKAYDSDYYFCGMRLLIEYDYVRRCLREDKEMVITTSPLTDDIFSQPFFIFDEQRAAHEYGCDITAQGTSERYK